MQCPNCRTENGPGAKFCTGCGTALPVNPAPSMPTNPSVPPVTGGNVPPSSPYPQQNGPYAAPSPYPPRPYPQASPPAPVKKSRGGLIALIVILVFVLIIAGSVGIVMLLKARNKPEGAGRQNSTEEFTSAVTVTTVDATEKENPPETTAENPAGPVSGAAERDYSILYGVWTSQSGDWQIYILPDGTYHFSRPDGYFTGSVQSEKGGYGMYLNDGSRLLNDSFLSFDQDDGNCLTYVNGDGQVYLYHSAEQYEGYDYQLVTLYWGDAISQLFSVYDHCRVDRTDNPADILVSVQYPVTDFKVLDLQLKDVSQAGELSFNVSEVYELPILLPRRPALLTLAFAGDIPNRGISFTDPNGNVRRYYISVSGYDGSYSLTEF